MALNLPASGLARSTRTTKPSGSAICAPQLTTSSSTVTIASRCTSRKTSSSSTGRSGLGATTPSARSGITSTARYSSTTMRHSTKIKSTTANLVQRKKDSKESRLEAREPLVRLPSVRIAMKREVLISNPKKTRSCSRVMIKSSQKFFNPSTKMSSPSL